MFSKCFDYRKRKSERIKTMFHSIFDTFLSHSLSFFLSPSPPFSLFLFCCVIKKNSQFHSTYIISSAPFGLSDRIHLLRFNSTLQAIIRRISFCTTDVSTWIHAHIFVPKQQPQQQNKLNSRIIFHSYLQRVDVVFNKIRIVNNRKKITTTTKI